MTTTTQENPAAETDEPEQLSLLPAERPKKRLASIGIDELPPNDRLVGEEPDADLIRSIRASGVAVPIEVRQHSPEDGVTEFLIIDGVRRVKAVRRILAKPGRGNNVDDLRRVPAVITTVSENVGLGLTLALHATRRPNPIRDLEVIETLLARGFSADRISAETGFTVPKINERLRLRTLSTEFREAMRSGKLTAGLGKKIAALSPDEQTRLWQVGLDSITLDSVRDMRSAARQTAAQALLDDLPPEGPIDGQAQPTGSPRIAVTVCGLPRDGRIPPGAAEFLTMVADALLHCLGPAADIGWIGDRPIVQYPGRHFRVEVFETASSFEKVGERDGVPIVEIHESDEDAVRGLMADAGLDPSLLGPVPDGALPDFTSTEPVAPGNEPTALICRACGNEFDPDAPFASGLAAGQYDCPDCGAAGQVQRQGFFTHTEQCPGGCGGSAIIGGKGDRHPCDGLSTTAAVRVARRARGEDLPGSPQPRALRFVCPEDACQAQIGVVCHTAAGLSRPPHARRERLASEQRRADAAIAAGQT